MVIIIGEIFFPLSHVAGLAYGKMGLQGLIFFFQQAVFIYAGSVSVDSYPEAEPQMQW